MRTGNQTSNVVVHRKMHLEKLGRPETHQEKIIPSMPLMIKERIAHALQAHLLLS